LPLFLNAREFGERLEEGFDASAVRAVGKSAVLGRRFRVRSRRTTDDRRTKEDRTLRVKPDAPTRPLNSASMDASLAARAVSNFAISTMTRPKHGAVTRTMPSFEYALLE
jgi:hypothetical protein